MDEVRYGKEHLDKKIHQKEILSYVNEKTNMDELDYANLIFYRNKSEDRKHDIQNMKKNLVRKYFKIKTSRFMKISQIQKQNKNN